MSDSVQKASTPKVPASRLSPAPKADAPRAIIKAADFERLAGFSRRTRYRLEKKGQLPARIKITEHMSGYYLDEVQAWLGSRPVHQEKAAKPCQA